MGKIYIPHHLGFNGVVMRFRRAKFSFLVMCLIFFTQAYAVGDVLVRGDLSTFNIVKDGVPEVLIVVGKDAAASDVIAATDIGVMVGNLAFKKESFMPRITGEKMVTELAVSARSSGRTNNQVMAGFTVKYPELPTLAKDRITTSDTGTDYEVDEAVYLNAYQATDDYIRIEPGFLNYSVMFYTSDNHTKTAVPELEGIEFPFLGKTLVLGDIDKSKNEILVGEEAIDDWVREGDLLSVDGYTIQVISVSSSAPQRIAIRILKEGVILQDNIVIESGDGIEYENMWIEFHGGFLTAQESGEQQNLGKLRVLKDVMELEDDEFYPLDEKFKVKLEFGNATTVKEITLVNSEEIYKRSKVYGPISAHGTPYFTVEYDDDDELWYVIQDSWKTSELQKGEVLEVGGARTTINEVKYTVEKTTVEKRVPVDKLIARVDSEVTEDDKKEYNIILVGGPIVNELVSELEAKGKLTVDYTKLGAGNGAIEVIHDAFSQNKDALIVAGSDRVGTMYAAKKLIESI